MGLFSNSLVQKFAFGKSLGTYISKGNGKTDPKFELFYKDIDPSLAKQFLESQYNVAVRVRPGEGGSVIKAISSERGIIVIRIPSTEVELFDADWHSTYEGVIGEWSKEIFDGRPVEVILTDDKFNDKRRIIAKQSAPETVPSTSTYDDIFNRALKLQDDKKYEDAIIVYTDYLEKVPGDGDAIFNRGLCYFLTTDHSNSVKAFTNLININYTRLPNCYWYHGFSNFKLEQYETAIESIQKAISLGYKNTEHAHALIAKACYALKKYEPAIEHFTKSLSLGNTYQQELLIERAIAYSLTNQYQKAIDDFTTLIKLKPEEIAAVYTLRGLAYIYAGDYEKANSDGLKSSLLNPEPNPFNAALKAMAAYYLGKGTIKELDDALVMFPGDGYLLYAKGRILLDMGEKETARTYLELAQDMEITEATALLAKV